MGVWWVFDGIYNQDVKLRRSLLGQSTSGAYACNDSWVLHNLFRHYLDEH